jgi:hypothetical protein
MKLKRRYPDGKVHIDKAALFKLQAELLAERCKKLQETMTWAVDKLKKWQKLLEEAEGKGAEVTIYDVATCHEIWHALSPDNPRLKGGDTE